jgi:hypothetical protein
MSFFISGTSSRLHIIVQKNAPAERSGGPMLWQTNDLATTGNSRRPQRSERIERKSRKKPIRTLFGHATILPVKRRSEIKLRNCDSRRRLGGSVGCDFRRGELLDDDDVHAPRSEGQIQWQGLRAHAGGIWRSPGACPYRIGRSAGRRTRQVIDGLVVGGNGHASG